MPPVNVLHWCTSSLSQPFMLLSKSLAGLDSSVRLRRGRNDYGDSLAMWCIHRPASSEAAPDRRRTCPPGGCSCAELAQPVGWPPPPGTRTSRLYCPFARFRSSACPSAQVLPSRRTFGRRVTLTSSAHSSFMPMAAPLATMRSASAVMSSCLPPTARACKALLRSLATHYAARCSVIQQ